MKDLYESRLMKDQIFSDIYDKFTKGEKLMRYDHYTREQVSLAHQKYIQSFNKKDTSSIDDEKKAEREKLRKQQLEMDEAAKKKEKIASQQASYLKGKESDIYRQQKRF